MSTTRFHFQEGKTRFDSTTRFSPDKDTRFRGTPRVSRFNPAVLPGPPIIVNPGDQISAHQDYVRLQMRLTQGTPPVTWTSVGDPLPTGLSLNASTGLISGTVDPSAAIASSNISIQATNGEGTDTADFKWTINAQTPHITDPGPQTVDQLEDVSLQLQFQGTGTINFSAIDLPPNLSVGATTGLISGQVSNLADRTYKSSVTLTNEAGSHQVIIDWLVLLQKPAFAHVYDQVNFTGDTANVTPVLTAGTGTVTWSYNGILPTGITFDTATGQMSGTITDLVEFENLIDLIASNADHTTEQTFRWEVIEGCSQNLQNPGWQGAPTVTNWVETGGPSEKQVTQCAHYYAHRFRTANNELYQDVMDAPTGDYNISLYGDLIGITPANVPLRVEQLTGAGHWSLAPGIPSAGNRIFGRWTVTSRGNFRVRCGSFDGDVPDMVLSRPMTITGEWPQPWCPTFDVTSLDSALLFNGTTDYMTRLATTEPHGLTLPFTFACWTYTQPEISKLQALISIHSSGSPRYQTLHWDTLGRLAFSSRTAAGTIQPRSGTGYNDGEWHFVFGRMDATNIELSIDGGPFELLPHSHDLSETHELSIGRLRSNNDWLLAGGIDEVAIWDRHLLDAEKDELWNVGDGTLWSELAPSLKVSLAYWFPCTATLPSGAGQELEHGKHMTVTGNPKTIPNFRTAASEYFDWNNYPNITQRGNSSNRLTVFTSAAAQFDGTNYLQRDEPIPDHTGNRTIYAWFKQNGGLAAARTLLSKWTATGNQREWRIYVDAANAVRCEASTTGTNVTYTVLAKAAFTDTADWHFIAYRINHTLNESHAWFGNDARVTGTPPGAPAIFNGTSPYYMANEGGLGQPFNCSLDNVLVFYGVHTDAQVEWVRDTRPTYNTLINSTDPDNPGIANLVKAHSLDETSGIRMDATANRLHMTPGGTNPVTAVPGVVEEAAEVEDRALKFNDTSKADTPLNAWTLPFTFACWVKLPDDLATYRVLQAVENATNYFFLEIRATGQVAMNWRTTSVALTTAIFISAIKDEEYHLISGSVAADGIRVSVDGQPYVLNAVATVETVINKALSINDNTAPDIDTDEVMFFDSQLSDADISELYNESGGTLGQNLIDGSVVLTSGKVPINAWPLSRNITGGAYTDIGTTGGLTLVPTGTPTDTPGIPEGQSLHGAAWRQLDLSNNNNHVIQNTWNARPQLVNVDDSFGFALEFDGVNDFLSLASFVGGELTQPNDVFLVVELLSVGGGTKVFLDGGGATTRHSILKDTSDVWAANAGTALLDGAIDTSLHVVLVVFNGISSEIYIDGGAPAIAGDAGTQEMNGLFLGAQNGGAIGWIPMRLRQHVVNNGALTKTARNAIGRQLASEHGLDWITIP